MASTLKSSSLDTFGAPEGPRCAKPRDRLMRSQRQALHPKNEQAHRLCFGAMPGTVASMEEM